MFLHQVPLVLSPQRPHVELLTRLATEAFTPTSTLLAVRWPTTATRVTTLTPVSRRLQCAWRMGAGVTWPLRLDVSVSVLLLWLFSSRRFLRFKWWMQNSILHFYIWISFCSPAIHCSNIEGMLSEHMTFRLLHGRLGEFGSLVMLECSTGFYLGVGHRTLRCLANGTWEGSDDLASCKSTKSHFLSSQLCELCTSEFVTTRLDCQQTRGEFDCGDFRMLK